MIVIRYFEQSLIENLRICRGSRFRFDDHTLIPSDFKENFVMNSANKYDLGHYIAEKLMDFHSCDKVGIGTLVCVMEIQY